MRAATVPNTIDANRVARRADWLGTVGAIFLVVGCLYDFVGRMESRDRPKGKVGAGEEDKRSLHGSGHCFYMPVNHEWIVPGMYD